MGRVWPLALLLLLFAGPVFSQTPEDIVARSEEALNLATEGQLEKAVSIWEDILDQCTGRARLDVHVNLAVAFKMLGMFPESWHHLKVYLDNNPLDDPEARDELNAVSERLAKDHLRINLICQPEGTTLFLSSNGPGKPYQCPMEWWFKPGRYFIRAEKRGFSPETADILISQGVASKKITLTPEDAWGELTITSAYPQVGIILDGVPLGVAPVTQRLRVGKYKLSIIHPGQDPLISEVVITREGLSLAAPPPLPGIGPDKTDKPPAFHGNTWEWAILGGGAALVATAGVLHYLGYDRNQELQQRYPADQALSPTLFNQNKSLYQEKFSDEVVPLRTASYFFYGAGAAAVLTGVVFLAIPDKPVAEDPDANKTTFAPFLLDGAMGLDFKLEF